MPQILEASYKAKGTFNHALYFVIKNGWLQEEESAILSTMNPEYEALIVNVLQLMNVNFSELFLPRLDYSEQHEIFRRRTRLVDAPRDDFWHGPSAVLYVALELADIISIR